jgi:hypothetical protein
VNFIIAHCPDVFQEEDGDSAQLYLDNLDIKGFEQLNEYVFFNSSLLNELNE